MTTIKFGAIALAAALVFAASAVTTAQTQYDEREGSSQQVSKKVRRALVTLPYYGVFDNLEYKLEGSTVTLYGQVVRPTTRKDADRRVSRIEGVQQVVNNIEVLPLSPFDDSIRVRTFRKVFRTGALYRYSLGTNPSIHIIVNHGHVTLEGVVANRMDRQLAYVAANGVFGVFSVTNNLQVDRQEAR